MYFVLLCLFFIKFCFSLIDYDDYIIEKYRIRPYQRRDMILKSSFCQYFNYLPICSETILYRPKKKAKIPFKSFEISRKLLNDIDNKFHRRYFPNRWYNTKYKQNCICDCNCPSFTHKYKRNSPYFYYETPRYKPYWRHRRNKFSFNNFHRKQRRNDLESEQDRREICNSFLKDVNMNLETIYNHNTIVQWNYESNITDYNKNIAIIADEIFARELKDNWKITQHFDRKHKCSSLNGSISRQFNILSKLGDTALPPDNYLELQTIQREMETIFSTATIVNADDEILNLEPDINFIMAHSKDEKELRYVWEAWRNETGVKLKHLYPRYVELINKAALLNGYANAADLWLSVYEDDKLQQKIEEIWADIQPLYIQLHAYVRHKLKSKFDMIDKEGPLPAHILGNIFGQSWIHVYNATAPFPEHILPDITAQLQYKAYTPKKMFEEAENFFKSINLSSMTDEFWKHSIIEPKQDVEMVCHASAWDMYDKKDFRIKMCAHVTYEDFIVIHHEMGHVEYYMQYKNLPVVFREGANPGFHEAIGDTIALSVSSPTHLTSLDLLKINYEKNASEKDLNFLYLMALQKIAFIPYALVVDKWRWDVFKGKTKEEDYNKHWWDLRLKYQGIKPPGNRTNYYFDPGAKYHIAAGVPYIRYFISFVIQFQFHESLCREAGRLSEDQLFHKCDIFYSQRAGNLLKKMLSLGQSKPWPEAMFVLTNEKKIDAKSLLLYFKPLEEWLTTENAKSKIKIGWD